MPHIEIQVLYSPNTLERFGQTDTVYRNATHDARLSFTQDQECDRQRGSQDEEQGRGSGLGKKSL